MASIPPPESRTPLRWAAALLLSLQLCLTGHLCWSATAQEPASANVVDLHFNAAVMRAYGLRVVLTTQALPVSAHGRPGYVTYRFRTLPLDFASFDLKIGNVRSQRVRILGGMLLAADRHQIDLREGFLRPHATDPMTWTLEGAQGQKWLEIDHAHQQAGESTLQLREGDARLTREAAISLGYPERAGAIIGGIDMTISRIVVTPPIKPAQKSCSAPWPSPNAPARIRLFAAEANIDTAHPDTIAFERCMRRTRSGEWDVCTAGSNDGWVVFAPDATLRNIGTSAVPWYPRMSGRHPPYDNDQHPFLIWNLYRIDKDGMLRQIARSGVKHAFFAVNAECPCPTGHVVYPHCVDTYSSYNNDSPDVLGPRSEVLPAQGIWGRCGSIADPSCDGKSPAPRAHIPNDALRYRLAVNESELSPAAHPGAKYFFEYGYLIRDSDRPDGAFGYRNVTPRKAALGERAASWSLEPGTLTEGLVIDAWAAATKTRKAASVSNVSTPNGNLRVAVRVTRLPNGRYRYRYAIANIDWAVAQVSGSADRMRISDPHGIAGVLIPLSTSIAATNPTTTAEDLMPGHPWSVERTRTSIGFHTTDHNELTWGELITIAFDADSQPRDGTISLEPGTGSHSHSQPTEVETEVPRG